MLDSVKQLHVLEKHQRSFFIDHVFHHHAGHNSLIHHEFKCTEMEKRLAELDWVSTKALMNDS